MALVDQYRLSAGSAAQQQRQVSAQPRQHCSSSSLQRQGHTSSGPRPYYYRVRQQLGVGAQRPPPAPAATTVTLEPDEPEDTALAWRRHIYGRGLRAVLPGAKRICLEPLAICDFGLLGPLQYDMGFPGACTCFILSG